MTKIKAQRDSTVEPQLKQSINPLPSQMPNITNKRNNSHSITPPIDENPEELVEDVSQPASPVNVKPIKKITFKPSQIEQMNF